MPDDDSWDRVWKSCLQAAKILNKELTEQDIPANWPELRRLHEDLWDQVYGRNKMNPKIKSNPVTTQNVGNALGLMGLIAFPLLLIFAAVQTRRASQ